MTVAINGYCDNAFTDLKKRFDKLQPNQTNSGSALVVMHRGETVVNLYTGISHLENGKAMPWQEDTLSLNFSCGKGILATLVHVLVSEGTLDYDVPIATYWKGFEQNGKAHITLRHILTHQSGLYDITKVTDTAFDMLNWDMMLARVEATSPNFSVNEKSAYQAVTFGWLVGGTIEKATGKPLASVLSEKLLAPLGIENDFFFGVPSSELSRVARIIERDVYDQAEIEDKLANFQPNSPLKNSNKHILFKFIESINSVRGIDPDIHYDAIYSTFTKYFDFWSDETLQGCMPAFNGTFTAPAIAKIYAMLANGGTWQGKELISKQVFNKATQIYNNNIDQVFSMRMGWRLGYHRAFLLTKKAPHAFGHSGINATMSWCDPSRELSFAYTHNFKDVQMGKDLRINILTHETLKCVDKLTKS